MNDALTRHHVDCRVCSHSSSALNLFWAWARLCPIPHLDAVSECCVASNSTCPAWGHASYAWGLTGMSHFPPCICLVKCPTGHKWPQKFPLQKFFEPCISQMCCCHQIQQRKAKNNSRLNNSLNFSNSRLKTVSAMQNTLMDPELSSS